MAGHSQYANIKHRKDAQDNKRGKIFQKISREIFAAVKLNGTNLESNPRLRTVLEKARSLNMPKDNINRAINKANNQNNNIKYENIVYEGYGPGSVAIIVHCLTDNKNRTASNVRSYFSKCHGKLATTNSVLYLFEKLGIIEFTSDLTADDILSLIIDFDILNVTKLNNVIRIEVKPYDLAAVSKKLIAKEISNFSTNEIINVALEKVNVENLDDIKMLEKLLDLLESDDDIQIVESNWKN